MVELLSDIKNLENYQPAYLRLFLECGDVYTFNHNENAEVKNNRVCY